MSAPGSIAHRLALPPGFRLHEYRIDAVLGHGGFGITYLATDTQLNLKVAIKEYLPSQLAVRVAGQTVHPKSELDEEGYRWGLDRFVREARTLARFRHRNLVRILRFFEANNTAYAVMEYEEGSSLHTWLQMRATPPNEREVLAILLPLLDALQLVHGADVLHRDIKPDNIYLRDDGSPVLLDFGAARESRGTRSRNLTTIVTPGYAPFEQYSSNSPQGPWTDIYSLAAVCYRMITGSAPPDAMDRLRQDPLTPAVEAGRGRYRAALLAAIDAALKVNEAERPQSIAQWRPMLLAADPAEASAATVLLARTERPAPMPSPLVPPPAPQYERPPAAPAEAPRPIEPAAVPRWAAVAAAGLAAIVVIGGVVWWQASTPTSSAPDAASTSLVVVDPDGATGVATIAQALARVDANGTIEIRPGVYRETLEVAKPVHLRGAGGDPAAVRVVAEGRTCLVARGAGVRVTGLTLTRAAGGPCVDVTAGQASLEQVRVDSAGGDGVVVRSGAELIMRRSAVIDAGGSAVVAAAGARAELAGLDIDRPQESGVAIRGQSEVSLRDSRIRRTGANGIRVYAGGRPQVSANTIIDSGRAAVRLDADTAAELRDNRIETPRGAGILLARGSGGAVERNTIVKPGLSGIEIAGDSKAAVTANQIDEANEAGIYVYGEGQPRIVGNRITGSRISGLVVEEGADPVVEDNTIELSGEHGIYVLGRGRGQITRNVLARNKGLGVSIAAEASPRVSGNTLSANRAPQIVAVGGAAQVDGNRVEP